MSPLKKLLFGVGALFAVCVAVFLLMPVKTQTYDSAEILSPSEFDVLGDEIVRAIEEKDEKKILSFMWDKIADEPSDSLNDDERDYLFEGNFLRTHGDPRWRPPIDIIRLGKPHYRAFSASDGTVMLYFIPEPYLAESKKAEFFQENYHIKFFACEFYKIHDTWKMLSACLAGTDVFWSSDD